MQFHLVEKHKKYISKGTKCLNKVSILNNKITILFSIKERYYLDWLGALGPHGYSETEAPPLFSQDTWWSPTDKKEKWWYWEAAPFLNCQCLQLTPPPRFPSSMSSAYLIQSWCKVTWKMKLSCVHEEGLCVQSL